MCVPAADLGREGGYPLQGTAAPARHLIPRLVVKRTRIRTSPPCLPETSNKKPLSSRSETVRLSRSCIKNDGIRPFFRELWVLRSIKTGFEYHAVTRLLYVFAIKIVFVEKILHDFGPWKAFSPDSYDIRYCGTFGKTIYCSTYKGNGGNCAVVASNVTKKASTAGPPPFDLFRRLCNNLIAARFHFYSPHTNLTQRGFFSGILITRSQSITEQS